MQHPPFSSPAARPAARPAHKALHRAISQALLCSVLIAAGTFPARAQTTAPVLQQSVQLDLPAQALDRSISALAAQAGLLVLIPSEQFERITAPALRGRYSVAQALELLLQGSGYRFSIADGKRLQLTPVDGGHGATELPTQTVVGDWLANASSEELLRFPGARHHIATDALENAGAANMKEALQRIPGMQVRVPAETDASNASLSVATRGLNSRFSSSSTILLDGLPMSFAPYGQPQLSIAPVVLGNLGAVDVVKGGSSVRYGPQNVGGIINFSTPDIPKDTEARLTLRGEGATGEGENGEGENGVRGQANLLVGGRVNDSVGLMLLYSGSHGQGAREHSAEDIDDLMLKGEAWLDERQLVEARLHHFNAETEIPGGLTRAEYDDDPYQSRYRFSDFEGHRTDASLKYTRFIDDNRQLEVQGFYANTYRKYAIQYNPESRQRFDEWPREYDVWGMEARYSQAFRLGATKQEVSVGYRYIHEEADLEQTRWNGFAVGAAPDTVAGVLRSRDEAGTEAHAIYVDDRIEWDAWSFTPGVRFENIDVFRHSLVDKNAPNDFRNEESFTEVLPSFSIGYALSPAWTLFGNYNTSFGTIEHLQLSPTADNRLEPEIAHTVELGTRYRDTRLAAELTLFNIDFENRLQWDDTLEYHVNRGRTRHYGVEAGASYTFPGTGFNTYGNLAYTKATFREGEFKGKELPYYSRWVGNLGAGYVRGAWSFNLDGYAQSRQYSDDANTREQQVVDKTYYIGRMPGFMIWNARVGYTLPMEGHDARVSVGVKNLLDRRYYTLTGPDQPYGAGIHAGDPRTAYVELTLGL